LGENISAKKNTKALLDARKEVGLEVNVETTKRVVLPRYHTTEQIMYEGSS
jgi:hypothetical protein